MNYRDPKSVEGLVVKHAGRVMRRLQGFRSGPLSYEDILQELWIAWMIARDSFDPEAGASFKTYLIRGMNLHINRVIERTLERFEGQTFALSLDQEIDEDGGSVHEIVPDPSEHPVQQIMRDQIFEKAIQRVDPKTQIFLKLLKDPPEELHQEAYKGMKKAEYGRSMGITVAQASRVTSTLIFDFLGYTRAERTEVLNEARMLGELMCRK